MRMKMEGQRWRTLLDPEMVTPATGRYLELGAAFVGGFCLSAASLAGGAQPFALAVLCAGLPGWLPMAFALGGGLGYWWFWGQAGLQGLVWLAIGLPVCLTAADERGQELLAPGLAALIVAAGGLVFQLWQQEQVSVALYLLRIALAFGATCLIRSLRRRRNPAGEAVAVAAGMLALVQIAPLSFLNLGFLAAGWIAMVAPFSMVAMGGLALDLAGEVAVPMTAVLCLAYFAGQIPVLPRRGRALVPALAYLVVMGLCGQHQWQPLPALALGGLTALLPRTEKARTEAPLGEDPLQGRLEAISAVLGQGRRLLGQVSLPPLDEGAVIARVADRACGGCALRKSCPAATRARYLPQALLHQSAITVENMPTDCKKRERLLLEVQQGQDLYRLLLADRQRQQEYRTAVMQQYGFLSDYLLELADAPPQRPRTPPRYRPEVAVCSRGRENTNGDRCFRFPGTENRYYLLLCDGMGTGEGAAYEARLAGGMLRRMLAAGCAARAALQSVNSLCVLRGSAGAVTMDLAEADLLTGRVTLYKWGAAPSWYCGQTGVQMLGSACPPPGLSVEDDPETVDRLRLQSGDVLLLFSDGVDGEDAVAALEGQWDQPAGFLAALALEGGANGVPDDATAAVLRLHSLKNE